MSEEELGYKTIGCHREPERGGVNVNTHTHTHSVGSYNSLPRTMHAALGPHIHVTERTFFVARRRAAPSTQFEEVSRLYEYRMGQESHEESD